MKFKNFEYFKDFKNFIFNILDKYDTLKNGLSRVDLEEIDKYNL